MKKNYDQLNIFDSFLEIDSNSNNNKYEELRTDYTYDLPVDWEIKLKSYNIINPSAINAPGKKLFTVILK